MTLFEKLPLPVPADDVLERLTTSLTAWAEPLRMDNAAYLDGARMRYQAREAKKSRRYFPQRQRKALLESLDALAMRGQLKQTAARLAAKRNRTSSTP